MKSKQPKRLNVRAWAVKRSGVPINLSSEEVMACNYADFYGAKVIHGRFIADAPKTKRKVKK